MRDVMLFGSGWSGEVRPFEEHLQQIDYIPNRDDPHLRHVRFSIFGYHSDNGRDYWVAYSELEPTLNDIELAIRNYAPTPMDD